MRTEKTTLGEQGYTSDAGILKIEIDDSGEEPTLVMQPEDITPREH